MKKLWIGITAIILVMGVGSVGAYAATVSNDSNDRGLFENMLPFAKQMHPNLSDEQIKQMYNNCNNSNRIGTSEMMRNSQLGTGMMNF